ncbi:MAG: phage holin family protein [Victivallales bacterium]|nr:phage holin family protein [bacterium]MDD7750503.1 phage holin family protein [bacterium]MDY5697520.1 phage holin family protein [Victivallales bacterium]HBJ94943.1 hypothetical protein [Lentisphaeria bacterium]
MKTLLERIADLLPVLTLGALGGISRAIMSRKKDEPITLWGVLQEIIVAIFAGIVVHLLLSETGLWESVRTASVALAGYSSRSVLALLQTCFLANVKNITKGDDK